MGHKRPKCIPNDTEKKFGLQSAGYINLKLKIKNGKWKMRKNVKKWVEGDELRVAGCEDSAVAGETGPEAEDWYSHPELHHSITPSPHHSISHSTSHSVTFILNSIPNKFVMEFSLFYINPYGSISIDCLIMLLTFIVFLRKLTALDMVETESAFRII